VLKWAAENGCPWDTDSYRLVRHCGYKESFREWAQISPKWEEENKHVLNTPLPPKPKVTAASDHLDCLLC